MAVKHTFVSAVSDGGDTTLVRPSNWNADHTIDPPGTPIAMTSAASATVGAATAVYVPAQYEIAASTYLEIAAGGVMEIG